MPSTKDSRAIGHPPRSATFALLLAIAACTSSPPAAPPAPSPTPTPVAVTPHSSWAEAVLYFVVVDRFADGDPANNWDVDVSAKGTFHGGDHAGLRRQLDDVAGLGATAIWITPVVKNIDGFVTGAGFPDWGYHGYWADDFNRLDPRFGTEAELKALVDDCHTRGLAVLLDVVYNHAGYDSRMTTDPSTRAWFRTESLGTCGSDDLTSCVAGLPDLKTELPEVAGFLLDAQLGWAERSGVDGFRLDTVKHVDHPFWQEHRRLTRERLGQGFFLLGEVWGGDAQVLDPWFAPDEMDAGFDFGFQGAVIAFLQGRGRPVAFDRYLKSREKARPGYLLSHYLSSHDTPGGLFQFGGDVTLFRLAAVLQMTSVGLPMIYYGEEVARPGGDWPDNRSDMPWSGRPIRPGAGQPRDEGLRELYRRLIALRRAHPALWRGGHSMLHGEGDLLVYQQHDAATGDVVAVAINRGAQAATAAVTLPEPWRGRAVTDALDGSAVPMAGDRLELAVPGRSARLLIPALSGR
jgi:alpha-amylase